MLREGGCNRPLVSIVEFPIQESPTPDLKLTMESYNLILFFHFPWHWRRSDAPLTILEIKGVLWDKPLRAPPRYIQITWLHCGAAMSEMLFKTVYLRIYLLVISVKYCGGARKRVSHDARGLSCIGTLLYVAVVACRVHMDLATALCKQLDVLQCICSISTMTIISWSSCTTLVV